jgi:hypothetical protein
MIKIAVIVFVIDPIRYCTFGPGASPSAVAIRPRDPVHTSAPSRTTPAVNDGTLVSL